MDHNLAAETQAVERYLLGEMDPKERENFEEHFFTCAECAEDVRSAARFRANARAIFREPQALERPEKESRSAWWRFPAFVPMAASLLICGGTAIYQAGFEIPALKRQAAGVSASIATGGVHFTVLGTARSSTKAIQIPAGIPVISLDFDLPASAPHVPAFECVITDASNKIVAAPVIDVGPSTETLNITINRSQLPSGGYTITVRGISDPAKASLTRSDVIDTYHFIL